MVNRIFVKKLIELDIESKSKLAYFKEVLNIKSVESVEVFNGYDIQGLNEEELNLAIKHIFTEPNCDEVLTELSAESNEWILVFKLLTSQFDQRADSAKQCLDIMSIGGRDTLVSTFTAIKIKGNITDVEKEKIKKVLINPVESEEITNEKPLELFPTKGVIEDVLSIENFINFNESELGEFLKGFGLAMNVEDLIMIRDYFKSERRNPTVTEIKVIDTYWSDHCRHTTFSTELDIKQDKQELLTDEAYETYLEMRNLVYPNKNRAITLMDLATINAKYLRKLGKLEDLEVSDEVNAATIEVKGQQEDGSEKDYLLMFKNETHNHPSEIEPFGGAATCLGGAIRDPLSGRSYVYQGMRISGSADPNEKIEDTLKGKLPQRLITQGAANGFSSYGNQIGLATGLVREYYHENFKAKRFELGAVVGIAPKENVKRLKPEVGDVILMLGGKTGIDGCGGATGSSKEHDEESVNNCASEVQRGNAPEERKLQRLFSKYEFASKIKKSNDFGAGGVSVAIGELADSLDINLDVVQTKYEGIGGTELAISESQERMAVVIEKKDVEELIKLAATENVNAYEVATVTDTGRLIIRYKGQEIFNIQRDFLETNGAKRYQDVLVEEDVMDENLLQTEAVADQTEKSEKWEKAITDLNSCSQEGLNEKFDNTVGAGCVMMPYGGKNQLTPTQVMVGRFPTFFGKSFTGSVMSYGYDPYMLEKNQYIGGYYSVIEAIAKAVATGARHDKLRLTMQEYFERMGVEATKWQKPFKALLGATLAMNKFEIAAIGGKDSMSGTFNDINVPPSLVTFAVSTVDIRKVVTPEFKESGNLVFMIDAERENNLVNINELKAKYDNYLELVADKKVKSAYAVEIGGVAVAVFKMAIGNNVGFKFKENTNIDKFAKLYGSIVFEVSKETYEENKELLDTKYTQIGETTMDANIVDGDLAIGLEKAITKFEAPLGDIFKKARPQRTKRDLEIEEVILKKATEFAPERLKTKCPLPEGVKPKVFIPSFPGTNSEIDLARAFDEAGGDAKVIVFRNRNEEDIKESIQEFKAAIKESQIIAIPGGFSGGDEPDGSAKFICSVFKNPELSKEIMSLLNERDGLMLGICNGFQALVKLGLIKYGEIRELSEEDPTITHNTIGKHLSKVVDIEVTSKKSIWLNDSEIGKTYKVPVSHGEGRFYGNEEEIMSLIENGQVSTIYGPGNNLNGSVASIEGACSPDGRVYGKMGHAERTDNNLFKNVYGEYDMKIFEAGVNYFKK